MRATDTTPIRDPRNAVGMMVDVFDRALAGPVWRTFAPDNGFAAACAKIGREFSKMPRHYTNGYKRRGGSSDLYQRLKQVEDQRPQDPDWILRDDARRAAYGTMEALGALIMKTAIDALEDEKRWERFISETRVPGSVYLGTPATTAPPEWRKAWLDYVSGAIALGVDPGEIVTIECGWRFRDLTDRSHRGRNVRAAWEAAWLSGNYKFASQLIESIL